VPSKCGDGLGSKTPGRTPYWERLDYLPDVLDLRWEFNWLTGRNLQTSTMLLFAAVAVVLLIGCLNVANLLLGRALERQELAVRAALGSGRTRLIRQLLTERLLISMCGAMGGIVIGSGCVRYIRTADSIDLPPGNLIAVNGQVLAFIVALAVLT
jgi:ABC-type antimicrobial peptide transport system permease subunit